MVSPVKLALSFVLFLASFVCYSQLSFQVYNTSNSALPFNTVRCLKIDSVNQLIWAGTDNGLASFDGSTWTVYNSSNSAMTDNAIRSLQLDGLGKLWVGTTYGGLFSFDGSNWVNYTNFNSGLQDNYIRAIAFDTEANMWLATTEGISLFNGISWQQWNTSNSSMMTNNITSIAIGQEGKKYFGTINGGVVYFDQANNLSVFTIANAGLPDNSSRSIAMDSLGNPWYASPAGGLFLDNAYGGPWTNFNVSNSMLPSNGLTSVAISQDQTIFIGSEQNGLIIRYENNWFNYDVGNSGLPESHLLSLAIEDNTTLWLGTYNQGLVKMVGNYAEITNQIIPNKLNVYPNPSQGVLHVDMGELHAVDYQLFDSFGREIGNGSGIDSEFSISIEHLDNGYYFIRFSSENAPIKFEKIN
jgi:ligand-binding sensor domain-containing protein